MDNKPLSAAFVLGAFVCIGLALLGYFIAGGMVKLKALERAITVKGLSEREVPANIAIWPIKFSEANNDLNQVFSTLQKKNAIIVDFLKKHGFQDKEISISAPAILDRQSQQDGTERGKFRYSGESTITIYSENVDLVRNSMQTLVELGKQGIAISGEDYQSRTVFIFSKLNDLKPGMIEEATKNARTVAEKFAQDSKSQLGKIKSASQGQFSIEDRDSSTPHIKQVRVVSTVEYYLSD
ncbi:MAG: SIMPL domain-containing protein [Nitrosomonas sp.]|nr:MAG: SIMPL domain-containing protein [Nitrosomonas sp.]